MARATSAAPTYFEPVEAGDKRRSSTAACSPPTRRCARSPRSLNHGICADATSCCSRSGTGERTHKRHFDEIKDWGLADWARPILDVVFDGVSDAVELPARARAARPDRYWRFQVELTLASDDLDDASEDNLAQAARPGRGADRARARADLDAVLAKL